METIEIRPAGPVFGSIRPPGSKSITNRALVCAALARGASALEGALESEDTRMMVNCLSKLGIRLAHDRTSATLRVEGCDGRIPSHAAPLELFTANSGTTIRFLVPLVTLGRGTFRLDGVERMRQRPIQGVVDALVQLGARVRCEYENGCPPVIVDAAGLPGGTATVPCHISSQYLSGLMMSGVYARDGMVLEVEGELVSKPYVEMTLAVMKAFGVECDAPGLQRFAFAPGTGYEGRTYEIEPDASAASYFFAAAAVTAGRVTVEGLSRNSLQGDTEFCEHLARMGCDVEYGANRITVTGRPLKGIEVDMNAVSDTAQTMAVVALFAEGPTTITNIGHIRHKETDRIAAMAKELRKLGAEVEEYPDGLTITPGPLRPAEIDTYDDHRMAMSFAVAGLKAPGVVIRDPACTEKTYPDFFEDLTELVGG